MPSTPRWLRLALVPIWLAAGCAAYHHRTRTPAELASSARGDLDANFLKAFMRDGLVYDFDHWKVVEPNLVTGSGRLLDASGRTLRRDSFTIPVDSVVVFETNAKEGLNPLTTALATTLIVTVVVVGTVAVLKAIFGSCPTFYAEGTSDSLPQAEGFSSSIAPALEATDVDALYRVRPVRGGVAITMRNEALETHVVRSVCLLAAPRPPGGRVVAMTTGGFRRATALVPARSATAPEGDCTAALAALDGVERWSLADSTDLATHETLELEFPTPPSGDLGLLIGSRQTLLSTYLFYQALAYLGGSSGALLAAYERAGARERARTNERLGGFSAALGGIDVYVLDPRHGWTKAGRSKETGPIATDVRAVPLPGVASGPIRVRLEMNRAHWRLDYVALASLGARVEPIRLEPNEVRRGELPDEEARAKLLDSTRTLITLPGDAYTLRYRLPEGLDDPELFLESRGYYLEWIRRDWLVREDPARARWMFSHPRQALREFAPAYKRVEAEFETAFWNSRFARDPR